jgi:hypothetical protein
MMFPFAPAPGTLTGIRPTMQQPDAPLADDDRPGLPSPLSRSYRRAIHRLDPRTHCSRQYPLASRFASRLHGNLRGTRSRHRRRKRRRHRRNIRWMELPGTRPGSIRWHLPDRCSRHKPLVQNLRRTSQRRRRPRRGLQRYCQPLPQHHHRPRLAPASISCSPRSQPRAHHRHPLVTVVIFKMKVIL